MASLTPNVADASTRCTRPRRRGLRCVRTMLPSRAPHGALARERRPPADANDSPSSHGDRTETTRFSLHEKRRGAMRGARRERSRAVPLRHLPGAAGRLSHGRTGVAGLSGGEALGAARHERRVQAQVRRRVRGSRPHGPMRSRILDDRALARRRRRDRPAGPAGDTRLV
jgi:hypothetical protein